MKLRNRMISFTVLICIISILAMSGINYLISIRNLTQEVDEKIQLKTEGIAKDIDKWIALQKNSIYEVVENIIVNNDFEQSSGYNYLKVANDRNPGNSYYMAFSNKTYIDSTGWLPESSYDPTSRDWYVEAIATNIANLLDGNLNSIIEEGLSIRQKRIKDSSI